MKNAKRLFSLLQPHRKVLLTASLFLLISSSTNLALPLLVKQLVDVVMVKKNLDMLNEYTGYIALLLMAQLIFSSLNNYLFDRTEKRIVTDFRKTVFGHLQKLPISYYIKNRTGEIVSRLTNDVAKIESVVVDLPATALQQSVRLIGGVIIVVFMNWKLSFMILALAPVLVVFARTFGKKLRLLSREIQDKLAVSTIVLEENISGIQVVKSFVRESLEYGRFSEAVEQSFVSAKKRVLISSFFGPGIGFIAFGASLVLIWYGGREVIMGAITPGELIAFILYATIIAGPMGSFARMFTRLQEGIGASEKVFGILDTPAEILENPLDPEMPSIKGKVEINDLRFRYREDREVLKGISFTAEPGTMTALVGPSGAGKSTLANLLQRFHQPESGQIMVDGIDTQMVQLASYRNQIGMVPQETVLFGGQIYENIRYAKPDAPQEEITEAAKAANAHEFIIACPEGYQTVVGEKGIKLSAGQRQRIAIARAILKNPNILILDEATSALDNESEALIQQALERLMNNRTSFVIAHRLSTIHNADKIVVMDEGKITEIGTHGELLEKKGLYHYLYTLKQLETEKNV
jgi:subfamily B ATP-binding cassette protein MsbA